MRSRKSTEVRQEEIIRAALTIVERNGLDKLNINEIALEVNLVPAAIYRHFTGKEEIIAALVEFTDKCLQHNLSQVKEFDGTAVAKLKLLFDLHADLIRTEGAIPRILYFLLSSDRSPGLKKQMLTAVNSYVQQVKQVLLKGQQTGEISPHIDIAAAAVMFLGMVQALAVLSQVNRDVLNDCPANLWQNYERSITL